MEESGNPVRATWFRLTVGAVVVLAVCGALAVALPRLLAERSPSSARPGVNVVANAQGGYTIVGYNWPADAAVELQLVSTANRPLQALPVAHSDGRGSFRTDVVRTSELLALGDLNLVATSGTVVMVVPFRRGQASAATLPAGSATPNATASAQPTPTTFRVTATPYPRPTEGNAGSIACQVVADQLNLRAGPATTYAVLARLARGELLRPFARDLQGAWIEVSTEDGTQGWVSAQWMDCGALDLNQLPVVASPLPTATTSQATPATPTTTPGVFRAWRGEYYANDSLQGAPAVVRDDPEIRFAWGEGGPASGIAADHFSVRWTRRLGFARGNYRWRVGVDDSVRLWVDGTLLLDHWGAANTTYEVEYYLSGGEHDVRLEYAELGGLAQVSLEWAIVPAPSAAWRGEYYANERLGGVPALVRSDSDVAFDWGYGAPAPGLGADNFSVRWSRTVRFSSGVYRFSVKADDGVRLWVAGNLLIDRWAGGAASNTVQQQIWSGEHVVVLEYFELRGTASAKLAWDRVENKPTPTTDPVIAEWRGEYFAGTELAGSARLVRNERELRFDWGRGSPGGKVPKDSFSARFSRRLSLEEGVYRWVARADDGVRLYVDGQRVLGDWRGGGYRENSALMPLAAGNHDVRVEYFEDRGVAALSVWWERVGPRPTATPSPYRTPTSIGVAPTATQSPTPTAGNTDLGPMPTARSLTFRTVGQGREGCQFATGESIQIFAESAAWDGFRRELAKDVALGPVAWEQEVVLGVFVPAQGEHARPARITQVAVVAERVQVRLATGPAPKQPGARPCYHLVALSRSLLPQGAQLTAVLLDDAGLVISLASVPLETVPAPDGAAGGSVPGWRGGRIELWR